MRCHAYLAVAAFALATTAMQTVAADEKFSIVIDPFTGAAALRNDSPQTVQLDGYLLTSAGNPVLNPAGWVSLESAATPGWRESFSSGNRLGELNLFDSLSIGPGENIGIGNPYTPFAPTEFGTIEPGIDSLKLTYSLADGISQEIGDVEFSSRNTVVLVVNPGTGEASLVNQSSFDINLDSYLITSPTAVLDADGWGRLQSSLGTEGGWLSAAGASNHIAEGNLFGSSFLAASGGSLPLGSPIDPDLLLDETDLQLRFTIEGSQSITGGVLFAPSFVAAPLPGDFNGDLQVDAADFTVWRDALGSSNPLNGNGDETGSSAGIVDQADYLLWKTNFGSSLAAPSTSPGLLGGGSPVPEPSAVVTMVTLAMVLAGWRRLQTPR